MTFWNYRILRDLDTNGEESFSLYEVYYDDAGNPDLSSDHAVGVTAVSVEDLKEWLDKALKDPVLYWDDNNKLKEWKDANTR